MIYKTYQVVNTASGPVVSMSEMGAVEIGCDVCLMSWLSAGVGPLRGCPYCDDDGLNFGEVGLYEQSVQATRYGRDIRGTVRAFWSGAIDIDQAFVLFSDTVRLGLTSAWYKGAAECGITPEEMTPEERIALQQIITRENLHIFPFLLAIEQGNKASGGLLSPFISRANVWALRYDDVFSRAKTLSCADQKTKWTIDYIRKIKQNCGSCLKLNGKVKRNSFWFRSGVLPQNPPNDKLECGGWLCGCGLVETDEPLSRGPLPRLP